MVFIAPGYRREDFVLAVAGTELRLRASDFDVTYNLRCRVDPSSAVVSYRNGILSARFAKAV